MVPIMEESGLIIPVGRYVLWEAAGKCKEWQAIMPNFHVHVNLSYVQVHKSDLMNDISLAIDDFGTGYSNMRYLKEIEAKNIKLDRSFVLQALTNDYDYTFTCHIINMIHSVGSTVCMEGVEYDHELDKMKGANPDMIQGFLFGKPSSVDEFKEKFLVNYRYLLKFYLMVRNCTKQTKTGSDAKEI